VNKGEKQKVSTIVGKGIDPQKKKRKSLGVFNAFKLVPGEEKE